MNAIFKFRPNYIFIPLLIIITASAASYFADAGREWYKTIHLPMWTPSNTIMVAAWAIIFVLLGGSVLLIWNRNHEHKKFGLIIGLFVLNALLIVGWNILFFIYQQIGISFFYAIVLTANILYLVFLIWPFSRLAAYLLVPYTLWVLFATALTLNVWMIN